VDGDVQVLAARLQHLLVEQRVAGVGADGFRAQVFRPERGQDADHHHPGTLGLRSLLGGIELVTHLTLVLRDAVTLQDPRRDVDLEVEAAELGHERGVVDAREDLGVAHDRVTGVVDEVQFHLHPREGEVELEELPVQHLRQNVQAAMHLLPIALAVLAGEAPVGHVLAHAPSVPQTRVRVEGSGSRAAMVSPAEMGSR